MEAWKRPRVVAWLGDLIRRWKCAALAGRTEVLREIVRELVRTEVTCEELLASGGGKAFACNSLGGGVACDGGVALVGR